jgi:sterol desaturase/sphingolipid hydroxylase (fatty acid hydroxylase superfamily)
VAHRRLSRRGRHAAAAALVPLATATGWAAIDQAERRRPFDPAWLRNHGDVGTDAVSLVASAVPVALGQLVGRLLGRRLPVRLRLERVPSAVAVPIALATFDLYHYAWHRLAHEWGPAWRLHVVHHSPERLYWFNATRFHLAESLIEAVGEGALGEVFGLGPSDHAAYLTFRGVYGQVQHANVDVDCGVLDRVFSTPELHRWHHSVFYDEGDRNYGAMTSIWDQLLGTWFRPARPFDSPVGVGRMAVFPTSWAQLQRVPLDWEQIKRDNAATWNEPAPRS